MGLPQKKSDDLNKEFLEFFTATAGVHAIAQKDGSRMEHRFTKDLLSKQFATRDDLYFTANTLKKRRRLKSFTCEVNAICVDLDYYKTKFTKEAVLYLLPDMLDEASIFQPTAIQDSGNGLYLWWRLEPQIANNEVIIRLQEKVTKAIQTKLIDFGADPQSTDVLHLYRLPGSINTKNGNQKESYIEYFNSNAVYELRDFVNEVLPDLQPKKTKVKRRIKPKKEGEKSRSVNYLFNPFTLVKSRAKDIEKLVKMRNYDLDGCRHTLLLFYAVQLTLANDPDYEQKVYELNDSLILPIRERSVNDIIKRLREKAKTEGELHAKTYLYKNETIIDKLSISEYEQSQLSTIIGQNEYNKRQRKARNERYAETKEKNQTATQRRNERILELKAEGFKHKQVLEIMQSEGFKVSFRTIERIKESK